MRIAITGATGNIGKRLAQQLIDQGGHEVVLLVRDPAKVADLSARGATVKVGDLEDATFATEATQGVDALFFMIPPKAQAPDFRGYQRAVIANGVEAVKANQVKHVVLLSSVGAQHAEGTGPIAGLHDAEVALKATGVGLTILRPASFMENYLWSLGSVSAEGNIYLPLSGDLRTSMIATQDIAAEAARAIVEAPPASPIIRELAGPSELTYGEAAAILGSAAGKTVQHVEIPGEAAKAHLMSIGTSEDMANKYVEMYGGLSSGHVTYEQPQEQWVRTPTSFAEFASSTLVPAMQSGVTA